MPDNTLMYIAILLLFVGAIFLCGAMYISIFGYLTRSETEPRKYDYVAYVLFFTFLSVAAIAIVGAVWILTCLT